MISLLLDLSVKQWISFVIVTLAAYLLSWPVTKLTLKLSFRLIKQQVPSFDKGILRAAYTPLRVGFAIAFFAVFARLIDLPEHIRDALPTLEKLAFVFTLTWLVFSVVNVLNEWVSEELKNRGKISVTAMLPLFRRAIKSAVVLLAFVTLLQNVGVNVSALLAGLGVGGIAVALAAQKTLENVFGGVMLILDQTIRVGDLCKIGTQQGTVEDIGLRSTKIRTPDHTIISIPNSNLSALAIENIDARGHTRLQTNFSLLQSTQSDQLKNILRDIHALITQHPRCDKESIRVRLVGLDLNGFSIEVIVDIQTRNPLTFGQIRSELLLDMIDVIVKNGSALAQNTTSRG